MFQRSILQNQIEKCLPATPSSSFYPHKGESSLPRVLQRRTSSPSARGKHWLLMQAAKEKSQSLFPPATAEQDPVKRHSRY